MLCRNRSKHGKYTHTPMRTKNRCEMQNEPLACSRVLGVAKNSENSWKQNPLHRWWPANFAYRIVTRRHLCQTNLNGMPLSNWKPPIPLIGDSTPQTKQWSKNSVKLSKLEESKKTSSKSKLFSLGRESMPEYRCNNSDCKHVFPLPARIEKTTKDVLLPSFPGSTETKYTTIITACCPFCNSIDIKEVKLWG